MRKSLNAKRGVKVNTVLGETKAKPKRNRTTDTPEEREKCFNCEKPMAKCKGNCWGRL